MEETIAKKFSLLKDELNERQSRLWAATEALSLGCGGISALRRATGISRVTITKGIREIQSGARLEKGRIRKKGGGRKALSVAQPKLKEQLDRLLEPTSKGSPVCLLRWTIHSTRRLAEELEH
jgi:hypothetical protein